MDRDRGLLIVNADDWGYDEETTRAISDCRSAGGLTSTTAMVFMRGSSFAASLAEEHPALGIGLHLNLVEEYSDPSTPADVRARQSRLIDYFRRERRRRWIYDPLVRRAVASIIEDQLRCFDGLYGRPPTHVDGHHHCHLAANVLLSGTIPRGTRIRNALTDVQPNPVTKALRRLRRRLVLRGLTSTDFFFSIATVWPKLSGPPPRERLELARRSSVEIMVHPAFPHEYEPLRSDDWVGALRDLPTGTFADL